MVSVGRTFTFNPVENAWKISTDVTFTEAHVKRVLIELAPDLGFGELEDRDSVANQFLKNRGDLIDKTTGDVIEIEHDWRNFRRHGHDPAKIDILVLGPDSSEVPEAEKKNLPPWGSRKSGRGINSKITNEWGWVRVSQNQ